ncbi:MAG TPA: 30S ribosomal protein S1 [bacterium]|nr:30S ribosomal protein S1 [bacterium]
MEKNEYSFRGIRDGSVVKGRVIRKQDGEVFFDIGYKSDGIIPAEEASRSGFYESAKEGDEMDVYVKRLDGHEGFTLLSRVIAEKKAVFAAVKKASRDGESINGRVIKAVKGGFIVDFGANVTAFLPMSHSKAYGGDITGKELPLKVIQLDEVKRNVVVSYKEHASEQMKKEEEVLKKTFTAGTKAIVKVAAVKENGIEAEKNGVRVFIPAQELSWKRIKNIGEEFPEGSETEVFVSAIDRGSAVLSVKKLKENPFEKFLANKKPGDRVKVKVKEFLSEGMIVEVESSLDGYIHCSELSYYRRIKNPAEVYREGDEIDACIVRMDETKNRMYLSVKRMEANPWHSIEERYPVGARVSGVIKRITEGEGADVELDENFDAYLHVSNIAWDESTPIASVLKEGDKREFKIIGIDKNKYRILVGLKQLVTSPWAAFAANQKEGNMVEAKIVEIEDSAVVCAIGEGITGRILIRDKNKLRCAKGDVISARITRMDKDAKRIILSAKDLEITEEKKEIDEYMKSHEHTIKLDDIVNFDNKGREEKK